MVLNVNFMSVLLQFHTPLQLNRVPQQLPTIDDPPPAAADGDADE
jgi:hypothetical protein